jgi:hypothetical protein
VLADSGARVYTKNGTVLFTRIPLGAAIPAQYQTASLYGISYDVAAAAKKH